MKNFRILGSAMMLLGMISACTAEKDEPGKILENETTSYLKVSLVSSDGMLTRADGDATTADFENGTAAESKVESVLLVFYDKGRNFVGQQKFYVNETDEVDFNGTDDYLTIERILTQVVEVNLPENMNQPAYVMAYVNPTSAAGDLSTDKLEDVINVIRQKSSVSPGGFRTMNNSVYYNTTSGNTRFAKEIEFDKVFFKTKKEAAADDAPAVEITVERMEAKVALQKIGTVEDYKKTTDAAGEDEGVYTLQFVPDNWFVNGTEKRSFLIKNYRKTQENYWKDGNGALVSPTLLDYGRTYSEMLYWIGEDRKNFNDQEKKRSYWAIDPTYFYVADSETADIYPSVSHDVNYSWGDKAINPNGKEYPLEYRSYNNAMAETSKLNTKTHEYCLENTQNLATLKSGDAKASLTSVVLIGHYVVKDKSGNIVFDGGDKSSDGKSMYIRHEGVKVNEDNKTEDVKKEVFLDEHDVINFLLERTGSVLFIKEGEEFKPLTGVLAKSKGLTECFELTYPSNAATSGTRVSEQWRTVTFNTKNTEEQMGNFYVYDTAVEGHYRKLKRENINDNTLLANMYSAYGVVEKFEKGRGYFNVPLKHIWGTGTGNTIDQDKVRTGDYGVVRNHVYKLTINSITGLATGIGDPDQPIVPPTESEKYYVNAKLNILKWRIVNQSVDL